ncbi:MAG: three-Cys-motif partner protein TcmP, partial [Desulfomonile tiedjei]|nr:three-Cys-motif partner protein TcmP [Desulfomonile tiedjei]
MAEKGPLRFDEIGYWSEIKLEILRKYAVAFTTIIGAQARKGPALHPVYIDGFAGAGEHISKTSGGTVPGSPKIALDIVPPFSAYHFVDMDQRRVD